MNRLLRVLVWTAVTGLVMACGGGGSSNGANADAPSTGNPTAANNYGQNGFPAAGYSGTLSISKTAFSFVDPNLAPSDWSGFDFAYLSSDRTDIAEIALLSAGDSKVSTWLDARLNRVGTFPFRYQLTLTPKFGLPTGHYSTPLRVAIYHADGSEIEHVDLSVEHVVHPNFWLNQSITSLYLYNSTDTTATPFQFVSDGAGWRATSSVPWLKISPSQGTTPAFQLSMDPPPGGLAPGDYQPNVEILDTLGRKLVVPVSVRVKDVQLTASPEALAFNQIVGSSTPSAQPLYINNTLNVDGTWTIESDSSWLLVERSQGPMYSSSAISIAADNTLPSGNTVGNLTVRATFAGREYVRRIPVTRVVSPPEFTVYQLVGPTGLPVEPFKLTVAPGGAAMANLGIGGGIEPNGPFWNRRSAPAWLTFGQRLHPVPANGNPQGAFGVVPDWSLLSAGLHTGTIRYDLTVGNETFVRDVPVSLDLRPTAVVAATPGMAMTSTPGYSSLIRSTAVQDDVGMPIAWTASSNQPWLTVAASGAAGETLVMVANPGGLAADNFYEAWVTIGAAGHPDWTTDRVHVGLWVGSTDAPAVQAIPGNFVGLAVNPVLPHIYLSDGTDLHVHHLYGGARLASLPGRGGLSRSMAVSADGTRLYGTAADAAGGELMRIDVPGLTDVRFGHMTFGLNWNTDPVVPTRIRGRPVVFTGNTQPLDGESMTSLPYADYTFGPVAVDARRATAIAVKRAPPNDAVSLIRYATDLSLVYGGNHSTHLLPMAWIPYPLTSYNDLDLAMSADGTQVLSSKREAACQVFRVSDLALQVTLPAAPIANNVEAAADGRIACGSADPVGPFDVSVFSSAGNPIATLRMAPNGHSLLARRLVISGDSQWMIGLTDDPGARIVRLPSATPLTVSAKRAPSAQALQFTGVLVRQKTGVR